MGGLTIGVPVEGGGTIELTLVQWERLRQLAGELGEFEWHQNHCRCCVTVHPKGQHDRGYVIGDDGGYDWVGPVDEGVRC